jgi:hypothetical protein
VGVEVGVQHWVQQICTSRRCSIRIGQMVEAPRDKSDSQCNIATSIKGQKKDKGNQEEDEPTKASKPLQSVQLAELSQTRSQ